MHTRGWWINKFILYICMIPFSSYPSMTAAAAQKRKIRLYQIASWLWHHFIWTDDDVQTFPYEWDSLLYSIITAGVLEMLSWERDLYAKDISLHIFRRIFWEKNLRFRSWRGIGNGEMLQMDVYGVLIYRYIDPRKTRLRIRNEFV